jgi:hypothetical protein
MPALSEGCVPASGSNGVPLWAADVEEFDDACEEVSDCRPSRRAEAALRAKSIRELRSGPPDGAAHSFLP